MRLCLFNAKGGVGRTTLALQLAGYFANAGQRVLLIDRDPQGSALAWAALAEETPFTVGRSRSHGFDVELIDMPPKIPDDGVLPQADLFLVPTLLDGVAFVVFLRTRALLDEQRLPYLPIANRFNEKRAEHRARIGQTGDGCLLRERAAFASSYAQGRTVFDLEGRHLPQARDDIALIAQQIARRLP